MLRTQWQRVQDLVKLSLVRQDEVSLGTLWSIVLLEAVCSEVAAFMTPRLQLCMHECGILVTTVLTRTMLVSLHWARRICKDTASIR